MRILNRCTLLALAAGLTAAQPIGSQEPPAQPPAPQPRTHTVVRGDNLWDLSQTYLGNPFLWPEIYRLNRDVVEDPHWIYPGEVLRLPGDTTVAVSQLPQTPGMPGPTTAPLPVDSGPPVDPTAPTVFSRGAAEIASSLPVPATGIAGIVNLVTPPTVRAGEVLVAPYVDREGGPRGFGRIVKSADLAGVAEASDRFRFQAYDKVLISPPAGYVAPEGERYLAIKLGPMLEQGQIIIPTGVVEVFRAARSGVGAIAKIVRVFNEISTTDRLIPLDTAGVGTTTRAVKVADGPSATIKWIYGEPVLPSVQNFIVLDVSSRNGVRMGDEFIIYKPSPKPEEGEPRERETLIAKAQVVRSTPYGATAIIIGQEQPAIKEGMTARVSAKMP
jgi:hypothetical protein